MSSLATPLLQVRDIFHPLRYESFPIGHPDLGQTLGIHDIALLDNVVAVEQISGQSIHLVGAERSLLIQRHGTVDVVPDRRHKRQVTPDGFHRVS